MAKQTTQRWTLGFDIDGTITHPETFVPYLNEHFKKNLTMDDLTDYDLTKLLHISFDELMAWMEAHEESIYERAETAPFVPDILARWQKQHRLVYISARHPRLIETTTTWFKKQRLPYDDIELLGSHHKIDAVKKHHVDIFFEDKHDNACDIAEQCQIPVILFDLPYNRMAVPDNVYRVSDWKEAAQIVEHHINKKKSPER